ncbi:hypothetical protein CTEN210_01081 [Chaetoceros tenuissimus]|uniref:Uncharacterized protein n=1 Tax=Chaetoceros tenuissimus TaxID=426638 RepID=A0AAD3CEF4_9STRA|nr:hypothetical protein CTEN210_01081 [Chaetoceros tenuissimus]
MNKADKKEEEESFKILLKRDKASSIERDLWLISDAGKHHENSKAMLIEANELETSQELHSLFPKGYVKTNITDLTQLRNVLNQVIPNTNKKEATTEEMNRFEVFRSVITHEDELLNHRVSWIILAQSFLMAAYITATDASNASRFITATVGLLTVIVTLPAIIAAGSNVDVQQQVYFRQIQSDERCIQLHGHTRDLRIKASPREERARLENGHILPNMAFRGRSAIRILYTAIFLAGVQILGWAFLLAAVIHEWE